MKAPCGKRAPPARERLGGVPHPHRVAQQRRQQPHARLAPRLEGIGVPRPHGRRHGVPHHVDQRRCAWRNRLRPPRAYAEGHRERPGRDVVEAIALPRTPELQLELHEGRVELGVGLKDRLDQVPLRLREVDHVAPGLHPRRSAGGGHVRRSVGQRHVARQAVHLDPVVAQLGHQRIGAPLRVALEHHRAHGTARVLCDRLGPRPGVVVHQLGAPARRGAHRGPLGGVVLPRRLLERAQHPIVAPDGTTRRRGRLEEHPHAPGEHRPPLAIAGIERVVALAAEVGPPVHVEGGAVRRREDVEPLGEVRRVVLVVRLARRGEVERGARPLLVQVDRHVRPPLHVRPHAPARLGVRLDEPVAIEVEVVVRRARPRPRARIVERPRLGGQPLRTPGALHVVRVPLASVGVLVGIDEYDGAVERHLRFGVGAGRELVEQPQPRLHPRCLAPVHRVREPDHRRQPPNGRVDFARRRTAGVGHPPGIALEVGESGVVGLARDGQEQHLAPLEGARHRVDLHPLRGRGHPFDVAVDQPLRGEARPQLVAQHGPRCRDPRIVAPPGVGKGVLRADRAQREGGRQGERGKAGPRHAKGPPEWA
jgi:hypothetical protein